MPFIKNISSNDEPDIVLVEKFQSTGDLEVLAVLFQRYMDLLYTVCLKYTHGPDAAKDAVMQVFEELVQKLPKHKVENFRSWLYSLAKNYCLMQIRTPKNLKTTEFNPDTVQSGEELHPLSMSLEEENLHRMQRCLEKLPKDQRACVELFYLQGKCYSEIADLQGVEWGRIRSNIQNGRRNLRVCMEKTKHEEILVPANGSRLTMDDKENG